MAQVRNVRPGYTVIHPNRDKASAKITRLIVVLFLLGSAVLMLVLTIGGWSKFQGMKPFNFILCLLYLVLAFYILTRWTPGLLPLAALLGILLLIVAVVATTGLGGTSWFDRNTQGFAPAQSILGGGGLSTSVLGSLTLLLIPVEIALIVVSMVGFSQGWNVEQEVPDEEAKKRGSKAVAGGPEASTA